MFGLHLLKFYNFDHI